MNTEMKNNRIEWVDIAKGIGIIFVVMGHMPSIPENIRLWIFSFHMPLFFYLSGYFVKPKQLALKEFILKKVKHLIIPYIVYSVMFILSDYLILDLGKEFLIKSLIGIVTGQGGNDILWFFFSLFLVDTIFLLLCHICKNAMILYILIGICVIIGYIGNVLRIGSLFKIAPSLYALGFYSIGYWANKAGVYRTGLKLLPFIGAAIVSIVGSVIIIKLNGGVLDFNSNRAFDIVWTYLVALCGIYCVIGVSRYIKRWKVSGILSYVGANSFYFYPLTGYIPNAIVIFLINSGMPISGAIKIFTKLMGCFIITIIIEFNKVITYKKNIKHCSP